MGESQLQESKEFLQRNDEVKVAETKEKHHKDKSKCTICIRKRAEREARKLAR